MTKGKTFSCVNIQLNDTDFVKLLKTWYLCISECWCFLWEKSWGTNTSLSIFIYNFWKEHFTFPSHKCQIFVGTLVCIRHEYFYLACPIRPLNVKIFLDHCFKLAPLCQIRFFKSRFQCKNSNNFYKFVSDSSSP